MYRDEGGRPPPRPWSFANPTNRQGGTNKMSCACNRYAYASNATAASNTSRAIEQIAYTSSCPGSCLSVTSNGYRCGNGCYGTGSCGCYDSCGYYCRWLCGCSSCGTDTGVGCTCSSDTSSSSSCCCSTDTNCCSCSSCNCGCGC